MKAAPYAALGAAVVAGWVSSPAVAFPAHGTAEPAAAQVSCSASFLDQVASVRLAPQAGAVSHAHGTSCSCAACLANAAPSE